MIDNTFLKSTDKIIETKPNKYIKIGKELEHRLVVEKKIKRKLRKKERVHHLDEIKYNNKISNLMLFKNQKAHKSFENKVKQFGLTNNIKRQIKNRWKEYK